MQLYYHTEQNRAECFHLCQYIHNHIIIFRRRVLRKTSGLEEGGELLWDLSLCNLLAWFIIFLVLSKGVETLGKVRKQQQSRNVGKKT